MCNIKEINKLRKDLTTIIKYLERVLANDTDWLCLACLLRIQHSVKSVILLFKKKHIHDGLNVLRSILETTIVLYGILKLPNFIQKFNMNYNKDNLKMLNILRNTKFGNRKDIKKELKAEIAYIGSQIEEYEQADVTMFTEIFADIANKTGLSNFRARYYRFLSCMSHPYLQSLQEYIRPNGLGQKFEINKQPTSSSEDIGSFYEILLHCLKLVLSGVNEKYSFSSNFPPSKMFLNVK